MLIVKFPNGEYTTFSPTSGSKLGKGATADIYRFQHDSKNFAAKIYKNVKSQDREKIDAMIAMDSAENPAQGNIPFCSLTWPMARIENNAALVGFAMPILDHDEFIGFESFFDYNLRSKLPSSDFLSVSLLVDLAYRLAEILTQLHSNGIYVVDLKPQNIRISKKNLSVHILDCDGFSIKGKSKRYPAEHISADYISPETSLRRILPTDLGEGQDRYTFAVMVFQLLNRGIHPFQGVVIDSGIDAPTNDQKAELGLYAYGLTSNASIKPNPRSVHTSFPTSLRFLFDKAFTQSDLMRPSLIEWRDYFSSLAVLKKFKRCEHFPLDVAHIHFSEGSCSECYLLALSSQIDWKSGFSSPQKQVEISQPSVSVSKPKSPNFLWVFFLLIFIVFAAIVLGNREPVTASVKPASSSSSQQKPLRIVDFDDREGEWEGFDYVVSIKNPEPKNIVFSSIWGEYKVAGCGDNIATQQEMILIQKSLAGKGYRVGADGKFGPRTKSALTEFQKNSGLSPTGLVTRETAKLLGISISGYGVSSRVVGFPVGGFGIAGNSVKKVRFFNLGQKIPDEECFYFDVRGNY